MRQRPQRESVLIDVGRFLDQGGDKISGAHVMQQVAEILIAAGVVAHVLDQASTVGIPVRLLQVVRGGLRKALQEHGADLVFPRQVDNLFVSENRVGRGWDRTERNGKQRKASKDDRAHRSHARPLDAKINAAAIYLPTTSTTKESGKIGGRGCGCCSVAAGGGPNFAVTRKIWCVFGSTAMVRAPRCVGTLCAML